MVQNFRHSRDRILCKSIVRPERQSVRSGGGTFEVFVAIRYDCAWTATAEADFVSVTYGAHGTGSGVVRYRVAPNTGEGRSGRLIIAGHPIRIDQPGPDSGGVCDRTAAVAEAITAAAPVEQCWLVTSAHLAAIDGTLNLRDKQIAALLPGDFAGLSNLDRLFLSRNDLTTLPAGLFAELVALRVLELYDNRLTILPEGIFQGLSNLKNLFIGGNAYTALPPRIFQGLSNLESLAVDGNPALTALSPRIFQGLSNLERLFMGGNAFTALPPRIFQGLSNLERLLMQSNKLTALPAGIFAGLSNLERLWMGGNAFTALPPRIFQGLSNLNNLSLSANPLRSLPEQMFADVSRLRVLFLTANELSALPPRIFADLTALETLWLYDNDLRELPAGIFSGLSNLRNLELHNNPGAPFTLTLKLVAKSRTATGGTVAIEVVEGAPFEMTLGLSATGGTLSADEATVGAGQTASPRVTVTRDGSTATVRPGAAPPIPRGSGCGLPRCFRGLELGGTKRDKPRCLLWFCEATRPDGVQDFCPTFSPLRRLSRGGWTVLTPWKSVFKGPLWTI